jgi:hypothetical protein
MSDDARNYLLRQLDIAWRLTTHHLNGLTTEECLWRPVERTKNAAEIGYARFLHAVRARTA